jgi:hypothetical protein
MRHPVYIYIYVCVCVYTYIYIYIYAHIYRVVHKSLTTLCKSQSIRNRWITAICDLIRPRGRSLGGVTLTAAIL